MKRNLNFFNFWLYIVLCTTIVLFNACDLVEVPQEEEIVPEESEKSKEPNPTEGTEVIINGVTWATRNLAAPGVFTANIHDFGLYYQWNRKSGWSTTDTLKNSDGETTWDNTTRTDNSWIKINDPSPAGWRVPTRNEINSLIDKEKVLNEWTTVKGIKGSLFTDNASGKSLFLPAAGNLSRHDGTLEYAGKGYYWSSVMHNNNYVYYLFFDNNGTMEYSCFRNFGQSIRCVKE